MAFCNEHTCGKRIFFLYNQKTKRTVPVNADTMSEDEIKDYLLRKRTVYFDSSRHVSHFKSCTAPNKFRKVILRGKLNLPVGSQVHNLKMFNKNEDAIL
jgi:hypothetical protein